LFYPTTDDLSPMTKAEEELIDINTVFTALAQSVPP